MPAARALSIRQPWAWAVPHAAKDVENRDWRGLPSYRGALVIHAGARREPENASLWLWDAFGLLAPAGLPLGAFLGAVQLVGARRALPGCCASPWAAAGAAVHIELADPWPFREPVPGKGQLGLWRPGLALPVGASR
jgi:hypothetical protein